MISRLVARAVKISNSRRPMLGNRTINPVTCIDLAGCSSIAGESAAKLIAYCIQLCPNLRELQACRTGDGRAHATMPLSADGALQVLRACNKHAKVWSGYQAEWLSLALGCKSSVHDLQPFLGTYVTWMRCNTAAQWKVPFDGCDAC